MSERTITITIDDEHREAIRREARRRSLAIVGGLDVAGPLDAVIGYLALACEQAERQAGPHMELQGRQT